MVANYFGLNLFREVGREAKGKPCGAHSNPARPPPSLPPPHQEPEVPAQVVQTPGREVMLAAGTPGAASAAADMSGFMDADDLLRTAGPSFGRRNIYSGGSGYDAY